MNWKVLVEQFLEGYHIRSTHKDTFYPDSVRRSQRGRNVRTEHAESHSRTKTLSVCATAPKSTWTVGHRVTYVYHLFPNVMVATFPNQVLVITIDPVDIDHTTVTIYAMVTPDVAQHVAADPDDAAGARRPAQRGRRGGQRNVRRSATRPACRGEYICGVRQARKRDRALSRHPRRAVGVHSMSRLRASSLRAARPVTIITINRPERMNAIGPQTHRELVDAWAASAPTTPHWSASSPARATQRSAPAVTLRQHSRVSSRRRQPCRRRARPVTVDRHLQADHRGRQRRRLCRRFGMGLLDRHRDRR